MLIEILLLNSRPCSTYETLNPSYGSRSTFDLCLLLAGGENQNQNGILLFAESLRRMATFFCPTFEQWERAEREEKKKRAEELRDGQMDPFHIDLM